MTDHKEAQILYPGDIKGRPTIELRTDNDGKHEAFLVPSGGAPISTGVYITQVGQNYFLNCRIRKKQLKFKPEEVVRQKILNWVLEELGYPEPQISVEVAVVIGGAVHDKAADIIIYDDSTKTKPWIIVEVKKPKRKEGIDQLKSYLNATGATFGFWSNGADEKFLLRTGPNDYSKPIWRLPNANENLDDIDEPLTREKLTPVKDLYSVFKDVEQEILAHQNIDTFNEIFKIVFAKLYDERVNLFNATAPAKFKMGLTESPVSVAKAVRDLFEHAKKKWKDVYPVGETIELLDSSISYCVQALQQYYLIRSGDVLGIAFELLVNQEMKGDKGQFFTPRQVVSMAVKMMNPRMNESVCDPACGSGGFLIYSMRKVFSDIDKKWDDADDRAEQRKDYAQENLVGIDNDQRLVRIAKAYMIMENDGRGGLFPADSLDYDAWDSALRDFIAGRKVKKAEVKPGLLLDGRLPSDGADLILTNPPFAGAIRAPTTLRQFKLALDSKNKMKSELVRAELFLERCIDMLKPGGRMAIVLPQGLFNNISDQYVRSFVDDTCRILAVVGLHQFTFKPFTLAKTSVLFLQKWKSPEDVLKEYEIFTAVSTRPGKTKLGRPQYLDDGTTLDCDMDEIANEFLRWAKKQKFELTKP